MQNHKVVLTGGTGFILGYVAERYAEQADEVVLFDNNQQHDMPQYTKDLLARCKNVRFVQGDITNKSDVETVVKGAEIVYHFAALMGMHQRPFSSGNTDHRSQCDWHAPCLPGSAGTPASSISSIRPCRPRRAGTPYIITKTAATQFAQMYHDVYGLPTVGLLIANCYGPRERAVLEKNTLRPGEGRKMMATFIEAALKNEPLPVMGDGQQSSDFVFVDDVVEACLRAPRDKARGQIMEIGSGIDTPVTKAAELIIELTGSKSQIKYIPLRTGEVKVHTRSDITTAKKLLDWQPKFSLREGLIRTIPWYAQRLAVEMP